MGIGMQFQMEAIDAGIDAYEKFYQVHGRPFRDGTQPDRDEILDYARQAFKAKGWQEALSGKYDNELISAIIEAEIYDESD